jgi:hypothetical protein
MFLLGLSYYGALGASRDSLRRERDVRDDRYVAPGELKLLRDLVRRLDPARLVTASFGGHDLTEQDVREALSTTGLDFLTPHRPRTVESPAQTEARTRECLDLMKRTGRVVPVHYQEPFRRGYEDWEPAAADFLVGVHVSKNGADLKAERAWVNKAAAMNFSSPVAVGHHLYGLGPAKNLFCVEAETGKLAWSKDGYITTSAEVAHAAFLAMGDNLLVCTDGGQLVLIAADPAECRERGRAQVCGLNWCNPAYAGGRLYLRDGVKSTGNLYCVQLVQ